MKRRSSTYDESNNHAILPWLNIFNAEGMPTFGTMHGHASLMCLAALCTMGLLNETKA